MTILLTLSLLSCGKSDTGTPAETTTEPGTTQWITTGGTDTAGDTNPYAPMIGRAYVMDLQTANWVEPEDVGSIIGLYLTSPLLIGVTDVSVTELHMMGAIGVEKADPPAQSPCDTTIDFPAATFSQAPYFELGPTTLVVPLDDEELTIERLAITGEFATDLSRIDNATLVGHIDTRPLVPLLDKKGEDDAVCELLALFGAPCVECENGSGPFCMDISVDTILAPEIPDTLTPIDDPCEIEGCCDTGTATP